MADEYGSRTLKNGDSGEDVYELQVRLVAFAAKDKPVPCDGTFDANTEAALKRFCKLFALPEQAAADSRVYSALQYWAREMKPTMAAFLESYQCKCDEASGTTLTKMNAFWNAHIKGKLPLTEGGTAGGPTCKGLGNGLKEVALGEKDLPWTYAGKKAQEEHPGISKTLFWAVMGLLKIYETDEKVPKIDVHNGYRCNRDYLRVKYTVNNTAAMGNHVGCAVDFHLLAPSGVSVRSHTQAHLAPYAQGAVKHCNNIRDDLQTFGVAETLQATPRNRLRLEPRNLATTWVHLDSTVYEKQVYVRTVEEAMAPEYTPGFYAIPVDVGQGIELTAHTVTRVYQHIEKEFAGGYFPVGGNTVWHGGVHLRHARSADVHACMGGTLIAARLPEDPAKAEGHYGSHNFILLQHTRETKTFFSLYMHLGRLPLRAGHDALKRFRWIEKAGGQQLLDKLRGGDVVKVGCEVKGGDPLWVIGEYGSMLSRAQMLHWEIFSAENLLDAPPPADPPLEGATGWSTENRILVQAIARIGEGHAYVDDAVKFVVTHCSFKDAPDDQYKPIRWLIESTDKAFSKQFDDQGLKLELKIPAELAGKTIRVWAFMHAKSDKVALDVRVAPGKRQKWIVAEDRDGNFNVDSDTILRLFPRDLVESDDLLSTNELVAFYRNNPKEAVEKLRFAVCKFTSEWGVSNLDAAVNALKGRGFFSYGLKDKLAPYMFWKEARSAGVDLPASPLTWHYHPVKLLETFCPAASPPPPPAPAPAPIAAGTLTFDQLKKISKGTDTNVQEYLESINVAIDEFGIDSNLKIAHFLAQVTHESGSLQFTSELGKTDDDYEGFKGRGLIQITWKDNYQKYGAFVGEDVTSSLTAKQKMERAPHAARSAGWFFGKFKNLNPSAQANDFIHVTYVVNGGFNGYNHRLAALRRAFDVLCPDESIDSEYKLAASKVNNDMRGAFGWGLWHDPGLSKTGCNKQAAVALEGYRRFIELHDAAGKPAWTGPPDATRKWYQHLKSSIRAYVEGRIEALGESA